MRGREPISVLVLGSLAVHRTYISAVFSLVNFRPRRLCVDSHKVTELVQGASFRGWKEVTSLFNKDDEQHLLERCKSPKSKGTNLRLKEELKAEKKSGFWDNLVLKQNIQSKKPDEIEGWEPPKLALEDISADPEDTVGGHPSWSGWEDDAKGSTKYTSLASSANSSRWSLRAAGRLSLKVHCSVFLRLPESDIRFISEEHILNKASLSCALSTLLEGCVLAPLLQAESQGCGPPPGTGTCCTPSQIQKRGHSSENAGILLSVTCVTDHRLPLGRC
ncbi:testis development-related protein isoform X4 [Homo sapiens]|uniref:testis development-related protein isoform X4 n=1 Tax=Homo sapiens TaxID=9606 RepID=UPI0023DFE740|nr:testis development-related protein isoform X4 [Homo sapiens]